MDKKAYIIQVLEMLKEDWPMAEGLLVLVEQNTLSDEVLDALIQMIQSAIADTDNELLKEKLLKWKEVFEQIKATEAESKALDQKDIADLEALIANI